LAKAKQAAARLAFRHVFKGIFRDKLAKNRKLQLLIALSLTFLLVGLVVALTNDFGGTGTPSNASYTNQNWVFVNASVTNTTNIDSFIINWNGTNVTAYDDSLVLLMHFNTVNASNWTLDESRYGNDGQMFDFNGTRIEDGSFGSNLTNAGKFDDAIDFDGVNDYIDLGDTQNGSLNITGNTITLMAWLNPKKQSKQNYPVGKDGQYAMVLNTDLRVRMWLWNTSDGWNNDQDPSSVHKLAENSWNHVAMTYNGTHIRIYLNSTLDKEVTWDGNLRYYKRNVRIGRYGTFSNFFNGTIDEVRIQEFELGRNQRFLPGRARQVLRQLHKLG
jgi:hypothetical protein